MLAGVAFALLLFFGVTTMVGSTPDTSHKTASDVAARWARWVASSGHRHSVIVGGFLTALAAIALIWFASAMRARVAPGSGPLMAFATLAAVGVAAASAGPLAITGGHTFGSDPVPTDGHVIWLTFSLVFPTLFVVASWGLAAFIATVVVSGRGVLPMWLIVFGWIAVVAAVFAVEFLPIIVVLLWFVAAGIYGAVRPVGAAEPATTT